VESLVEQYQPKMGNQLKWFLIISLLLHLIFFYFYGASTNFNWVKLSENPDTEEKQIVFEFEEKPKEVIETPNISSDAPENAELYSDKNMIARNPEKTDQTSDTPFSRGLENIPTVPRPVTPPEQAEAETKEPETTTEETKPKEITDEFSYFSQPTKSFSRDVLLGKKSTPKPQDPQVQYESKKFSVDDMGGFAFNTYNWNFAPYLLYLKKRIQQHIFPPPAFTQMGIIEGRTLLRFYISKDGKLVDLKVLNYEGHSSLMETSVNAINGSAPFHNLPRDFPEDMLEVTGTFIYKLYRKF